jgi:chromosome segregation ATPase
VNDPDRTIYPAQTGGSAVKTALVAGALVALLAANVYLYMQVDHTRAELETVREAFEKDIANLRETSSVTSASNQRHIDTLKQDLEQARRQASAASASARTEAMQRAEQLAGKLAEAQAIERQRVATELNEVREAASGASARIDSVSGEVGSVKNEVAATKSELEKTISELKSVKGDLGVQSGLIATNAHELDALKRLGSRNYHEFKLGKTKQFQRVGDIGVILKRTDQKRNRYTIEIMADDRKTEKKDKTVNEPVQFYVAKAKQPYELVVNSVGKDLIAGYLAAPKEVTPR